MTARSKLFDVDHDQLRLAALALADTAIKLADRRQQGVKEPWKGGADAVARAGEIGGVARARMAAPGVQLNNLMRTAMLADACMVLLLTPPSEHLGLLVVVTTMQFDLRHGADKLTAERAAKGRRAA